MKHWLSSYNCNVQPRQMSGGDFWSLPSVSLVTPPPVSTLGLISIIASLDWTDSLIFLSRPGRYSHADISEERESVLLSWIRSGSNTETIVKTLLENWIPGNDEIWSKTITYHERAMIATVVSDLTLPEGFYVWSCLWPNCKNQIVSTDNAGANHSGCNNRN